MSTSGPTFTYTFEAGNNTAGITTPTIANQTISTFTNEGSDEDSVGHVLGTKFLPNATDAAGNDITPSATDTTYLAAINTELTNAGFTAPGEYIYKISESEDGHANWDTTSQTYTMHVYLQNVTVNGTTYLTYAGIRVYSDPGTPGNSGTEGVKVDPTPGTDPTPGSTTITADDGDASQFVFYNHSNYAANFTVSKAVAGNAGLKNQAFPMTVTVAIPSALTQDINITYTPAGTGATQQTATITAGTTSTDISIDLKDGQSVTFSSNTLPNDATIQVNETELHGHTHTPSATITYANGDTTANDTMNGGKTATYTLTHGKYEDGDTTAAAGTNIVAVTNTRTSDIPTGIVMNNLPFIALGVIAIAGIGLYAASRKRRNEQE